VLSGEESASQQYPDFSTLLPRLGSDELPSTQKSDAVSLPEQLVGKSAYRPDKRHRSAGSSYSSAGRKGKRVQPQTQIADQVKETSVDVNAHQTLTSVEKRRSARKSSGSREVTFDRSRLSLSMLF
jgi:hypothetical protein